MAFVLFILLYHLGYTQSVHVVSNLSDDGPGSLRQKIRNAASGDIIQIWVSGELYPDSTIYVDKDLKIRGPMPAHFKIDGGNLLDSEPIMEFTGTAVNTLELEGVAFTKNVANITGSTGALKVGIGTVALDRCVFEDCDGEFGGAIKVGVGATVTAKACSFVNGNAEFGGAIYNEGQCTVINGAFHFNFAGSRGGAIYNDGDLDLVHVTITDNDAAVLGAGVYSASGTVDLTNNLLADNNAPGPDANFASSGTTWTSFGGNMVKSSIANLIFISAQSSDFFSLTADPGLSATMVEDGFGMKYFPIVDANSDAIDRGGNTSPYTRDLRRGYRVQDALLGSPASDAGAIEYTPFMVTNLDPTGSGGGAPVGSLGWAILGANATATPSLIVFDLPGPSYTISGTVGYTISRECIIDGYSQMGSVIPGPENPGFGLPVTPAVPLIEIEGIAGAGTSGITVSGESAQEIRGVCIYNFDGAAILVDDGVFGTQISGNHIGVKEDGTGVGNGNGIVLRKSSFNTVGGHRQWTRNVLSANDSSGVLLTGLGAIINGVYGNIVGADIYGLSDMPNYYGVQLSDSANLNLIGDTLGARNLISGNTDAGIIIRDTTPDINTIRSNWIGIDALGANAIPNNKGIVIENRANLITIGGNSERYANVVSGNDSAGIVMRSGVNYVAGNIIGLDPSGMLPIGNGADGIYVKNAALSTIGGGASGNPNYIGANLGSGIKVEHTTLLGITGNLIGITADLTSPVGNGKYGILLGDGTSLISIGSNPNLVGNIIVDNDSSGIAFINSTGGHTVVWNIIGSDTSGTLDMGNGGSGILIKGGGFFHNQIGDSVDNGALNLIAYNGKDGITIINESGNRIYRNYIFENGDLSIDLGDDGVTQNDSADADAGANALQNFPEILDAIACDSATIVAGQFNGEANTVIRIEMYAVGSPDPSGYGELEMFMGSYTDTTDASGYFYFETVIPYRVAPGSYITSTATDVIGASNTSEASAIYQVVQLADAPLVSNDTMVCDGDALDSLFATGTLGGTIVWGADSLFNTILDTGNAFQPYDTLGLTTYYVAEVRNFCVSLVNSVNVIVDTVDDPSIDFPAFCANTPGLPTLIATPGGDFDFDNNPNDGSTINLSTGAIDNAIGGTTYSVLYSTNGTCPADTVIDVLALDYPTVATNIVTNESCEGFSDGVINVVATGGTVPFDYSIDGGMNYQSGTVFSGLSAGTYDIDVADVNGCHGIGIEVVNVDGVNTLVVSEDVGICVGTTTTIEASGTGVILWLVPSFDDPTALSQLVSPDTIGIYHVQLDANGCIYTDSIIVSILDDADCEFHIFNAFSPDNDGVNDNWVIRGIEDFPENEVVIYNRWGDQLHTFSGYDNTSIVWDGTGNGGEELPTGTYFYTVQLNSEGADSHKGWVYIAR